MTVKIKELKPTEQHLVDMKNTELSEIHGGGPIAGLAAGFGTTLAIGVYGLATGQSTSSILQQQAIFGGGAVIGGLLTPGP